MTLEYKYNFIIYENLGECTLLIVLIFWFKWAVFQALYV
jgi:hypothetical protein